MLTKDTQKKTALNVQNEHDVHSFLSYMLKRRRSNPGLLIAVVPRTAHDSFDASVYAEGWEGMKKGGKKGGGRVR